MRCGSENSPTCWSSEVSGCSRNHSLQGASLKSTPQQTVSVGKKKAQSVCFFFFKPESVVLFSGQNDFSFMIKDNLFHSEI